MSNACEKCLYGRLNESSAPYVTKFGGRTLVVPYVPIFACDMCGWMEYDADFLFSLQQLIQQHDAVDFERQTVLFESSAQSAA